MSLTRDLPSTANDNRELVPAAPPGRQQVALAPRSPTETLEPTRPPTLPDREPPEEHPHPFLDMLDGLVSFVFILACLGAALYFFVKVQFDQPGPLATSMVFAVPRGEGVSAMSERLEREGVIDDRPIFMTSILYFKYLRGKGNVKAGEYEFRKNATMREVLDTLVEGKSIEHKVTLAEGLTTQQMVEKIRANPDLHGDIAAIPPEGSLLPDTYKFGRDDTRQEIIERMQAAQEKFLAKMWEERDDGIVVQTPEEALILASIVEKETGRADERPRIASVFQNRLRKNMRLQSDPTIIYGLVGGKGVLDHPIQQDELDRDTQYNTYKINGLPPTPIACPGRASIEAVLKPAKTKDLYFVADGKGGHVFAATLEDHNKNVAKWRQVEREIRAKEAQEAAAAAAAAAAGAPGEGEAANAVPAPKGVAAPAVATDETGAAGSVAADMPGAFADPDALTGASQGATPQAQAPVAAAAAAAATGDAPPKPLRNPKR